MDMRRGAGMGRGAEMWRGAEMLRGAGRPFVVALPVTLMRYT